MGVVGTEESGVVEVCVVLRRLDVGSEEGVVGVPVADLCMNYVEAVSWFYHGCKRLLFGIVDGSTVPSWSVVGWTSVLVAHRGAVWLRLTLCLYVVGCLYAIYASRKCVGCSIWE